MPEPYLFRYPDYYDNVPSTGLFGSSQAEEWVSFEPPSATSVVATPSTDAPKNDQASFFDTKKVLGEGVLESVVICIVLGVLMMAPNQIA